MKATMNATLIKRSLSAVALAVAAFAAPAHAASMFQDFQITTPDGQKFIADKISGNYEEILTRTSDTTFATSAYSRFLGFAGTINGKEGSPLPDSYGLNTTYGLYATFKATGNVINGGTKFQGTTGEVKLYLDTKNPSTGLALPTAGGMDIARTNFQDDKLLASTNSFVFGEGNTFPGAVNNANGDFALTFKDLNLTADGQKYFTSPSPFFFMQFSIDGNFSSLGTDGSRITGADNVYFAAVPEPTSIALLGLGLAGLGLSRRRKQA